MKKGCLIALGVPVGLVIFVVALFWFNYYDVQVRYRLTVEVQDGDQIKTGSSVIEASYIVDPGWIWEGPHTSLAQLVGNAPTVDLDEKGLLFLTFEHTPQTPAKIIAQKEQFFCADDDISCLPFVAYGTPGSHIDMEREHMKAAVDQLLRNKGPRDVPSTYVPQFARFLDINDPLTLAPVTPSDFAKKLGSGIELKRVTLELTNDPVTPPA